MDGRGDMTETEARDTIYPSYIGICTSSRAVVFEEAGFEEVASFRGVSSMIINHTKGKCFAHSREIEQRYSRERRGDKCTLSMLELGASKRRNWEIGANSGISVLDANAAGTQCAITTGGRIGLIDENSNAILYTDRDLKRTIDQVYFVHGESSLLAVAYNTAHLFSAATGKLLRSYSFGKKIILAFKSNLRILFEDMSFRFLDDAEDTPNSICECLRAFKYLQVKSGMDDNTIIAKSDRDAHLWIVNLVTNEVLLDLDILFKTGPFVYSPKDNSVVVYFERRSVLVKYDAATGKKLFTKNFQCQYQDAVHSLVVSTGAATILM